MTPLINRKNSELKSYSEYLGSNIATTKGLDGRLYRTDIEKLLKKYSHFDSEKIKSIANYINANGENLISSVRQNRRNIHISNEEQGLPVTLKIDDQGRLFIPLEISLGSGFFRTSELFIALSRSFPSVVVNSTQMLKNVQEKLIAERETRILEKIARFIESNPSVKGLLRYYTSIEYDKTTAIKKTAFKSSKYLDDEDIPPNEDKPEIEEIRVATFNNIFTHFCNGGNLKDKLRKLSEEEKYIIAEDLLTGLAWLHSNSLNIFHSDLKADNIFLILDPTTEKVVKAVIGDFGFACDLNDLEDRSYKYGHADYKAPELKSIKHGMPIDEKILACDVYSMGKILKEMFEPSCGKPHVNKLIENMLANDSNERPSAEKVLNYYLSCGDVCESS